MLGCDVCLSAVRAPRFHLRIGTYRYFIFAPWEWLRLTRLAHNFPCSSDWSQLPKFVFAFDVAALLEANEREVDRATRKVAVPDWCPTGSDANLFQFFECFGSRAEDTNDQVRQAPVVVRRVKGGNSGLIDLLVCPDRLLLSDEGFIRFD